MKRKGTERTADGLPHVLVTAPALDHAHRNVLQGVLDYARENGPWRFRLLADGGTAETADDDAAEAGGAWRRTARTCAGVIALSPDRAQVARVLRLKRPTVFVNPEGMTRPPDGCVLVARDQRNTGRMAAEHFIGRGYRSFAFAGPARPAAWAAARLAGFAERLAAAGFTCAVWLAPAASARRLGDWLAALPRPTALHAVSDARGQQILSLCLDRGLAVPGDLAVLATGDDAVLCETTTPPLSSISLDGRNTGRMCARILDDLLCGRPTEPVVDLAYPRIITRGSTEAFAVGDPILARVLSYVRAHLDEAPKIGAVARALGVSVRTVELKSVRYYGKPVRDVLLRMKLGEGVALLSNTNLPVAEIAGRCGFCNASHFSRAVKAAFGWPPGVFRARPAPHGNGTVAIRRGKL